MYINTCIHICQVLERGMCGENAGILETDNPKDRKEDANDDKGAKDNNNT